MIVTRDGPKITIEFDQPWEREVAQYIVLTYGPDFIKKHLLKFFYEKQRAMKFMAIKKQLDG